MKYTTLNSLLLASGLHAFDVPAGIRGGVQSVIQQRAAEFGDADLESKFNSLFNHGCWCAHADPANANSGGPSVHDNLDQVCKDWFAARQCTHLPNGACHATTDADGYGFSIFNSAMSCSSQASGCADATCAIDSSFMLKLEQFVSGMSDQDFISNVGLTCTASGFGGNGDGAGTSNIQHTRTCSGTAPDVSIVAEEIITPVDPANVATQANAVHQGAFNMVNTWNGPTPDSNNLADLNGAVPNPSTNNNRRRRKRSARSRRQAHPDSYTLVADVNCGQHIGTIRQQGGCGSCWAFAASEVASDSMCLKTGRKVFHSPQHMASCCPNCLTSTVCEGGYPGRGLDFFVNNGLVDGTDYQDELEAGYGEGCYPYDMTATGRGISMNSLNHQEAQCLDTTCKDGSDFDSVKMGNDASGMEHVWLHDEADIMEHIQNFGSMAMTFEVYLDFYAYSDGVYVRSTDPANTYHGRHAVKVVGWGTETGPDGIERDYWLCANSWGNWGDEGFFKMERGTNMVGCEADGFDGVKWTCADVDATTGRCQDSPSLPVCNNCQGGWGEIFPAGQELPQHLHRSPYTIPSIPNCGASNVQFDFTSVALGSTGMYNSLFKIGDHNVGQDCKPCLFQAQGVYDNNFNLKYVHNGQNYMCESSRWSSTTSSRFQFEAGNTYHIMVEMGDCNSFPSGRYMKMQIDGVEVCNIEIPREAADLTNQELNFGADLYNLANQNYKNGAPNGHFNNIDYSCGPACAECMYGWGSTDMMPVNTNNQPYIIPNIPNCGAVHVEFDVHMTDLGDTGVWNQIMKIGHYNIGQDCKPCLFYHHTSHQFNIKYVHDGQNYMCDRNSPVVLQTGDTYHMSVTMGDTDEFASGRFMTFMLGDQTICHIEIPRENGYVWNQPLNFGADIFDNAQSYQDNPPVGIISNPSFGCGEAKPCEQCMQGWGNDNDYALDQGEVVYTIPELTPCGAHYVSFDLSFGASIGSSGMWNSVFKIGDYNTGQDCKPCMHYQDSGRIMIKYYLDNYQNGNTANYAHCNAANLFEANTDYHVQLILEEDSNSASGRSMTLKVDGDEWCKVDIPKESHTRKDMDLNIGADRYNGNGRGGAGTLSNPTFGCGLPLTATGGTQPCHSCLGGFGDATLAAWYMPMNSVGGHTVGTIPELTPCSDYGVEMDFKLDHLGSAGLGSDYRTIFKIGNYNDPQGCNPCFFIGPQSEFFLSMKVGTEWFQCESSSTSTTTSSRFVWQENSVYKIAFSNEANAASSTGRSMKLFINHQLHCEMDVAPLLDTMHAVDFRVGAQSYNSNSASYAADPPVGFYNHLNFGCGPVVPTCSQCYQGHGIMGVSYSIADSTPFNTVPTIGPCTDHNLEFDLALTDAGVTGLGSDYRNIMRMGKHGQDCFPCLAIAGNGNHFSLNYKAAGNWYRCDSRTGVNTASTLQFVPGTYRIKIANMADLSKSTGRAMKMMINNVEVCDIAVGVQTETFTDMKMNFGKDVYNAGSAVYLTSPPAGAFDRISFGCGSGGM